MNPGFITYVTDEKIVYYGTFKMINSFYNFHPNIPLYITTTKDITHEIQKYRPVSLGCLNPIMTRLIAEEHDLVVHIDSDVIVADRLDEILEGDYDVAVARNNSDQKTAGCGPPYHLDGKVDVYKYANAGVVASTKKEFWDDWVDLNKKNFGKQKMAEQDNLNILIDSGKYDVKWLDSIDKPLYYNIASAYGDPKWNGHPEKHWESWERIEVKDNKLWLDNKQIKMLHYAGGETLDKFNFNRHFTPEVKAHLMKICRVPKKCTGE